GRGQEERPGQTDHEVRGQVVPGWTADVVRLARETLEVLAEEEVGERSRAEPKGERHEPAEADCGEEGGREYEAPRANRKRPSEPGPEDEQDREAGEEEGDRPLRQEPESEHGPERGDERR